MNAKALGERLKEMRLARGMTQEELAEALGRSKMAVSKYESGEMIPQDIVKLKYAAAFNCSVESIFFAPEVI